MIITADNITLSFLVVASVALAVVVVLVWYVYSSRKFKDDIIKLMDEKLEMYLDNLEQPKQEEEDEDTEPQKDENEFAEKAEQKEVAEELPQSFVEKDLSHSIEEISKFPDKPQ